MGGTHSGHCEYSSVAVSGLSCYFSGDVAYSVIDTGLDVSPLEHPALTMGAWVNPATWNSFVAGTVTADPTR